MPATRLRSLLASASLLLAAALAGCGSTVSRRGADDPAPSVDDGAAPLLSRRDGPPAHPPPGLELVPDAEPKVEPIPLGGANKPYVMFGIAYEPIVDDRRYDERGLASWYGQRFHGRRTASGETYNMYAMTAAHRTLPIPSYARVSNPANGRSVIVRINDRGPFHAQRVVDLSYTAALKLELLRGASTVEVTRLTHADILAGTWREPPHGDDVAAPEAQASSAAVPAPSVLAVPSLAPVAAVEPAAGGADPLPGRAFTAAARGWWVQLGAFRDPDGAEELHRRVAAELDWLAPLLAVFHDAPLHRLQAGPYASRAEAVAATRRMAHALGLAPLVVERR